MNTQTFETRAAAQTVVDTLDDQVYYLAHGESGRPTFTVRKVRGEDKYYIHAKYHYYSGTFYAKESGPLQGGDLLHM